MNYFSEIIREDIGNGAIVSPPSQKPDWDGLMGLIGNGVTETEWLDAKGSAANADEYGITHIYKVEELGEDEAIELLKSKAFKKHQQMGGYGKLVRCAVEYAKGLPLALKVLGSFLCGRNKDEWDSTLNRLKQSPLNEVQQALRVSYDVLQLVEKEIFLDIARFFKGKDKNEMTKILESCDFHPIIGIKVIVEKSLVSVLDNKLMMHDLIQELGWNIVHQESPKEPRQWSRLWLHEDSTHLLMENTGTKKDCKNHVSLPGGTQLESLEVLNVFGCSKLKNISVNFGCMKCLSELYFDGIGVSELPPSIGHLTNLVLLSLSNCKNLRNCTAIRQLLPSIGLMKKFETLSLEGCKGIASYSWSYSLLPSILQRQRESYTTLELQALLVLESLKKLYLNDCTLKSIPTTICHIYSLQELDLSRSNIESIPVSMNKLSNRWSLCLVGCKRLQKVPELSLDIRGIAANDCTSLRTILSLSKHNNVEEFSFTNCFKLVENEQNNILFLGIVVAVVGIKNKCKCKDYCIEVGFKCLDIQMIIGQSHENDLTYFEYSNHQNLEVIYVPRNDFPSSMYDDDMEQFNEGRIEFQACLVHYGHYVDCLTKADVIIRDVKLGVRLVYEKEDDEEAWSMDSCDSEDNMGVFHGDLERSVEGAGVEVASPSTTSSKRRHGDLNDNHDYDAAVVAAGPSGGFDDQDKKEDHPTAKGLDRRDQVKVVALTMYVP
ncbi:probable disease resistance protein At4g19520 [Camellia sinensis]|uniref:probable disease resistance protein At4g19520 n=1 Tax=Camellia sinensis TaxID=4442 RepID=UPI0010358DE1|nr:probable disease resistance protein At4g19520 [Camellia sinensis]